MVHFFSHFKYNVSAVKMATVLRLRRKECSVSVMTGILVKSVTSMVNVSMIYVYCDVNCLRYMLPYTFKTP